MLKSLSPLQKDEKYVSYDVGLLFTDIPLKETIDYIIHKIYNEKLLKPICKKKKVLFLLNNNYTFDKQNLDNNQYLKHKKTIQKVTAPCPILQ